MHERAGAQFVERTQRKPRDGDPFRTGDHGLGPGNHGIDLGAPCRDLGTQRGRWSGVVAMLESAAVAQGRATALSQWRAAARTRFNL